MPLNLIIIILYLASQFVCAQDKPNPFEGSTFNIYSKILNEERSCLVKLPDSYLSTYNSKKKYPVLILLDGSTHYQTTYEIVHGISSEKKPNHIIPETIVIAIENVDRERDYTFSKIETKRQNTTGGGSMFLEFIENELLPYIDNNYKTTHNRTLIGHSLAGLFTLNAFLSKNSSFEDYLSIDPSIWWDSNKMERKVNSAKSFFSRKNLYIATANQGYTNYEGNKKRHEDFYAFLKKDTSQDLKVKLEYFEDENHRSVPSKAILEGLKYLKQDLE